MLIKRRKAFSLIELVVVIIIIGILGVIGGNVGHRQIGNARISSVENNMQIFATDIENAVMDIGFIEEISAEKKADISTYLSILDNQYLTFAIKTSVDDIEIHSYGTDITGFTVETNHAADPWGNEYKIFYVLDSSGSEAKYRVIMASSGPNSMFSADVANAYSNKQYDDDIVLILEPRQ